LILEMLMALAFLVTDVVIILSHWSCPSVAISC
jgi:hypothetical protein